ncbi:GL18081 [Drosophila persimilis]|uniref:GL18081 n=1 Tax=Drosophila persimilis TaxID=7234 RepID=B4IRZ1_DROPE|nr:GL18081 [Drosophila persimilis]
MYSQILVKMDNFYFRFWFWGVRSSSFPLRSPEYTGCSPLPVPSSIQVGLKFKNTFATSSPADGVQLKPKTELETGSQWLVMYSPDFPWYKLNSTRFQLNSFAWNVYAQLL